jgi:hypothetical protein
VTPAYSSDEHAQLLAAHGVIAADPDTLVAALEHAYQAGWEKGYAAGVLDALHDADGLR